MEKIESIARAYYDFFANFANFVGQSSTDITFFENGWFLTEYENCDDENCDIIKIYDNEAKLRRVFELDVNKTCWEILSRTNLFIIQDCDNDTLQVYHRDTIIKEFKIKNLSSYNMRSIDDCALSLRSDEKLYVVNVKATYGPDLRLGYEDKTDVKLIQIDKTDTVLSADGLGLVACKNTENSADDFGLVDYRNTENDAYILDMNGQKKKDTCINIEFLYGFKAILTHYGGCYELLDYKNHTDICTFFNGPIILRNYNKNGIQSVDGGSVVILGNVLLAGANGDLLDECKAFPDIKFADYTPDVEGGDKPVFVDDYVIHSQGKKGFLPIDHSFYAKVMGEMLLVVYDVRTYYPIFPRFAGYKTWEDKEHYYYNKVFKQASVL